MALVDKSRPRTLSLTDKGYAAIGIVRVPLLKVPFYRDKKRADERSDNKKDE